jgi:hypothetical protein
LGRQAEQPFRITHKEANVLAPLYLIIVALSLSGQHQQMRHEWRTCSQTDVIPCIQYAAAKYGQPLAIAEQVVSCESSDNPLASNGVDFGLYQFLPSTFAATPYRGHSYWSARWSALAAMWAWSHGWQRQWQCYP